MQLLVINVDGRKIIEGKERLNVFSCYNRTNLVCGAKKPRTKVKTNNCLLQHRLFLLPFKNIMFRARFASLKNVIEMSASYLNLYVDFVAAYQRRHPTIRNFNVSIFLSSLLSENVHDLRFVCSPV